MALSFTTQPTSGGYYTAYLPIRFVAEDTNNADSLTFTLTKSDGTAISGVPSYKAPLIGGEYKFDASSYLKSILDVRTSQGLSTTTIEDLTDIYGNFRVTVTDGTLSTNSNTFFAFAFADNTRYLNNETANAGIEYKLWLYSGNYKNETYPLAISTSNLPNKLINGFNRVVLWGGGTLQVDTFQNLELDLSSYSNKLISVPMNKAYIQANFTVSGGGFMLDFNEWNLRDSTNKRKCFFKLDNFCSKKTMVYVNRYGAKESIVFETKENNDFRVRSEEFRSSEYTETGNTNYFNTSAARNKYNIETTETETVRSQKFLKIHKPMIKDFVKSPLVWLVQNGELLPISISDGNFKITEDSKGLTLDFKYTLAQRELNFI